MADVAERIDHDPDAAGLYERLGLPPGTSDRRLIEKRGSELKTLYRGKDNGRFYRILEAVATLADDQKRTMYDREHVKGTPQLGALYAHNCYKRLSLPETATHEQIAKRYHDLLERVTREREEADPRDELKGIRQEDLLEEAYRNCESADYRRGLTQLRAAWERGRQLSKPGDDIQIEFPDSPDYYKRLGLPRGADNDAVSAHYYRILSPILRINGFSSPDDVWLDSLPEGAELILRNTEEAALTLLDTEKRKKHERALDRSEGSGIKRALLIGGVLGTAVTFGGMKACSLAGCTSNAPESMPHRTPYAPPAYPPEPETYRVFFPPHTPVETKKRKLFELLIPACHACDHATGTTRLAEEVIAASDAANRGRHADAGLHLQTISTSLNALSGQDMTRFMERCSGDERLCESIRQITPQRPPGTPAHFAAVAGQLAGLLLQEHAQGPVIPR